MGTDIMIHSGVLVQLEAFLQELTDEQVAQLPASVQACLRSTPSLVECFGNIAFSPQASRQEILSALYTLVQSRAKWDGGKYEQGSLEDQEQLVQLVATVFADLLPDLPPVEGIAVFGSGRLSGLLGMETGKPFLSFGEDDCFERVLTPKGKTLAAFLNQEELWLSQWTRISS